MKLSKNDLIKLVEKIQNSEGTESEIEGLIEVLVTNVIDPNISDYIFYHEPELSAKEIVEKALAYKSIQL